MLSLHFKSQVHIDPLEISQLMRGGTRKVADSKPDAPATSKESDSIPMTYIGKFIILLTICCLS